jgi:hypothetical protein
MAVPLQTPSSAGGYWLSRYETALERSLNKALHELQRRQAAGRGQAVPLPEVVDVKVSVSGPSQTKWL